MKFYIKNNNLYYYDYLITDRQLSLILIPIALVIIYNKTFIKYFSYIFIYIAVIGMIDNYFKFKKHNLYFIFFSIIFLHALLLYPLINIKKYLVPSFINFLIGLLAIIIIIYLPFWPYTLKRSIFIKILIITYILLTLLHILNNLNI